MSRKSDFFDKIQMNLFEFLNLNPTAKFKDKDLLGPLKFLKSEDADKKSDELHQTKPQESINTKIADSTQNLTDTSGGQQFQDKTFLQVFGLPVLISRKPYRRYIRFSVLPNGTVKVLAPLKKLESDILKELQDHKDWILNSNRKYQKLKDLFPQKKFETGEIYPLYGENFKLKLSASDFKKPLIQLDLDQILFYYPESWDLKPKPEKNNLLKKYFLDFYKAQALQHINQRTRILSEQTKLFPKKISFRTQRTRWGSCSSNGHITFNYKLVAFEPDLIDSVIIHELCHLQHPNHSKRFWALVQSHCPNYKHFNKKINQLQYQVDFLSAESELYLHNPTLVE